jgi:hypothetical protein
MSFRGRIAEEKKPVRAPSVARGWIIAIAVGLALEGALVGILLGTGTQSVMGPVLLLPIAAILGWMFGPRRGVVAAIAPMALILVAELVRQQVTGDDTDGPVLATVAIVSVVLLLAGIAFVFGSIRQRYKPRKPRDPEAG